MNTTHTYRNITWIDSECPTPDEVRSLIETYGVHPAVAEELLAPSRKPRVTLYKNFIFLILHFPTWRHSHRLSQIQEVDFIIGKDFLLTTRYDSIDSFHKFTKVFEVNNVLEKEDIGDHAGFLFFHIAKKLYRSIDHELDYIHDLLGNVEKEIFNGKEKEMVFRLSEISRQLTLFSQALAAHDEVLASLREIGTRFFGEDFDDQIRILESEYKRAAEGVTLNKDLLQELRATNDSMLTTKESEAMRILTMMAFVTFPLSLIAAVFGINSEHTPIVGHPFDFEIIVGIMVLAALLMFAYFKYKRWL